MPKRRASDDEDDSVSQSTDADSRPSSSKRNAESSKRNRKSIGLHINKKSKSDDNSSASAASKSDNPTKVHVNADGDKYIDLGKKRRAVVRTFKGMPLVDIREYYSADGQEKPGKKGISLTYEQWQALREGSVVIDGLLAEKKNV